MRQGRLVSSAAEQYWQVPISRNIIKWNKC